jgi:predicted transcriptional regulator
MAARNIELDDDANQILDSMADAYDGNASLAISELLRAHETIESFLDELEASQAAGLAAQKERAERGFREGRFSSWQEVKRENGL